MTRAPAASATAAAPSAGCGGANELVAAGRADQADHDLVADRAADGKPAEDSRADPGPGDARA
jgi:hypothetical protein